MTCNCPMCKVLKLDSNIISAHGIDKNSNGGVFWSTLDCSQGHRWDEKAYYNRYSGELEKVEIFGYKKPPHETQVSLGTTNKIKLV